MSEYLKHKKSLVTKSKKKPVTSASSVMTSAVTSSPLLGPPPPPRLPTVSDDSKIRDTVLLVLHALSQSGSLGSNPVSFSAPSPVPDYTPHERGVTGGDGGPQPHIMGGLTQSSGVGACEYSSTAAPPPIVHSPLSVTESVSFRSVQGTDIVGELRDSASLGINPSPLVSSGMDQLRVIRGGSEGLSASAVLSPTSLLFPFPDLGFSSFPVSSSSSSFPASAPSSAPSRSLSAALPSSFPLPSVSSSSVASASFPSSASVTSALPPSVPSLLPSAPAAPSLPYPLYVPSSSSSLPFPSCLVSSFFFHGFLLLLVFLLPLPLSLLFLLVLPLSCCLVLALWLPFLLLLLFFLPLLDFSSRLAEYHAHVLGLSVEYQALARWFLGSGGVGIDFYGFVSSSYPHLVPELSRDFSSDSSLFLSALHSPPPSISLFPPGVALAPPVPPSPSVPPLFPSATTPAVPPFSAHLHSCSSASASFCSFPFSLFLWLVRFCFGSSCNFSSPTSASPFFSACGCSFCFCFSLCHSCDSGSFFVFLPGSGCCTRVGCGCPLVLFFQGSSLFPLCCIRSLRTGVSSFCCGICSRSSRVFLCCAASL